MTKEEKKVYNNPDIECLRHHLENGFISLMEAARSVNDLYYTAGRTKHGHKRTLKSSTKAATYSQNAAQILSDVLTCCGKNAQKQPIRQQITPKK